MTAAIMYTRSSLADLSTQYIYIEWGGASTGNAALLVEQVFRLVRKPSKGNLPVVKIAILHSYQPTESTDVDEEINRRRAGTLKFWTEKMGFHRVVFGNGKEDDSRIIMQLIKGTDSGKIVSEKQVCKAFDIPYYNLPHVGLLVRSLH